MATLPGAGRLAPASSITSTQSFELGGVKLRIPELGSVLIKLAVPLDGLNHQHFAVLLEPVILLISTKMLAPARLGIYVIMVWPSPVREVTVADSPEP